MAFIDKQLTCRDCNSAFVFTAGEQEFYASKGLQNEPVRCPPCRSARKTNRLTESDDGYVKYGVFASFGGRTPRQMHPATCAECGIMTEVPFQPRGDRPVYCSSCYNKIKDAAEAAEQDGGEAATVPSSGEASAETTDDVPAEASDAAASTAGETAEPDEASEVKLEAQAETQP